MRDKRRRPPPRYFAYGFRIAIGSRAQALEWLPDDGRADINVELDTAGLAAAASETKGGLLCATESEAALYWPDTGLFLTRGGRHVMAHPTLGVDEVTLRLLIFGPVLAVLLHQRGRLVLHGSAVVMRSRAVGLLGASGWGKSTLAGLLHRRGHRFLTDDVLAVDVEHGRTVAPGIPELKVWPDTATALGHDPDAMPRLHPREQKRARRLKRGFAHRPVPLDRLYVLAEGEGPAIEPLFPREALVELLRHSYGARTLQAIRTAEHFRQCARVAAEIPVARLRFPRSFTLLDRVARLVEEDCGHAP